MRLIIYYFSFALGLAFAVIVNMLVGRKNGVEKRKTALFTISGFISAVIGAMGMAQIYNAVLRGISDGNFTKSRVSLYGGLLFMPVLMLVFTRLQNADFKEVTDNCCTGVFLLLGTAKIGCAVYGCCYGIHFEHGIYNSFADDRVFPVQLLESLLTFIIAFVIYKLSVGKHKKGSIYPTGLILYGTMRFFVQFLRFHEVPAEENLVLFMDLWQIVSVVAVVAGIIWLFAVSRKTKNSEKGFLYEK